MVKGCSYLNQTNLWSFLCFIYLHFKGVKTIILSRITHHICSSYSKIPPFEVMCQYITCFFFFSKHTFLILKFYPNHSFPEKYSNIQNIHYVYLNKILFSPFWLLSEKLLSPKQSQKMVLKTVSDLLCTDALKSWLWDAYVFVIIPGLEINCIHAFLCPCTPLVPHTSSLYTRDWYDYIDYDKL